MNMKLHELAREHIKKVKDRYKDSSKDKKTKILNEICETYPLHRKYVTRLLNGHQNDPKNTRPGRKPHYDGALVKHLVVLWNAMERVCAKRMKAALPIWLPFYKDPELSPAQKMQVLTMSASTLERFLKRGRKTLKGLSATQRAKFLSYKIPIADLNPNVLKVGHLHADTVAHCGNSLAGQFIWSITFTDRLSAWTENRALPFKNAVEVEKSLRQLEPTLPFTLLSMQTDCGSEFMNYTVLRFLESRPKPVPMTRSRPYHKNDNAHVEQKNFTHVREIFGYDRIEGFSLCDQMNSIYKNYWNPIHNFFLPSMRLVEKERHGSRIKKKYDSPQTPYLRLMNSSELSDVQKQRLKERFKSLNPFELKKDLDTALKTFFACLKKTQSEKKAA